MKRLLDAWDRNGSTSGPNPWKVYDDDDGDVDKQAYFQIYDLLPSPFVRNYEAAYLWLPTNVFEIRRRIV